MAVVTRFPPSPTGYLHIGSARTALFNWLFARHHGGRFVLRIEDTDRERSTQEAVDVILEGLQWLGLDWDEGPYFQTQRFDRYREVVEQLLEAGKAYHCYCTREEIDAMRAEALAAGRKPRYDGRCRHRSEPREGVEPVVRFKNPREGAIVVDDQVRGKVVYDNAELDDLIIARSDGVPTYNLTVVVDDMDMGISHVIRGDDHLNNTPRQVNILEALGADLPVYAHVPMINGNDGKKLSKRHGAISVLEYREEGFLPEALINYLVRLGWAHGDQEIFSLAELIEHFDITELNRSAASFDPDKLLWLNQHYIKAADPARLGELIKPRIIAEGFDPAAGPPVKEVALALRERARTVNEMAEAAYYFYRDPPDYEDKAAAKNLTESALAPLEVLAERLAALPEWERKALHDCVQEVAGELDLKMGKVAQPLRVALTGGAASPPIDVTLHLIGPEASLRRVRKAIEYIRNSLKP